MIHRENIESPKRWWYYTSLYIIDHEPSINKHLEKKR